MTEYFKKIIENAASRKAVFEGSKQELQNQVSVAVIKAAGDMSADMWRLRERKTVNGLVRI